MEILLITVLLGAMLVSVLKLALLSRRWRLTLTALAVLPILFTGERAAAFNYGRMLESLGSSELLGAFCAAVVMQELWSLLFGRKLLDPEDGSRQRLAGAALLPSLLLVPGMFYIQVWACNRWPEVNYTMVGIGIGIGAFALLALGSAMAKRFFADRDGHILMLLNAEYLLLLLTVFLPVALKCKIKPDPGSGIPISSLLVLSGFLGIVGFWLVFFETIKKYKERKYHALYCSGS